MNDDANGHPDQERLLRFGLGDLDPTERAEIEGHVAVCDACCHVLRGQVDDDLIVLVRETAGAGGEHHRAAARATMPQVGMADTEPASVGLPVELIDHPRYRILRWLGSGGMGTVFLAEHRLMRMMVALKVVKRELVGRRSLVERFRREVQVAARLAAHPNIVIAHDAEEAGGIHFLVMEFIAGVDLDRMVKERGPLPVDRACDYVSQAALGLQHACDCGMVHRDIKPQNLMVTPEGRVKILDFGLARFAREIGAEFAKETAPGVVLGTVDYIAPEQANNPHAADIRADIYSLGCTLYYLLAGRPPFPDGSVLYKIEAHAHQSPAPLDRLRSDVPPALIVILDRMMAKDPALRFQTPAEVAKALAPFANPRIPVPAPTPRPGAADLVPEPVSTPSPPPAPPPRPPWSRRILGTTVAVGLIVLAGILFGSKLLRWAPPRPPQPPIANQPAAALIRRAEFQKEKRTEKSLENAISDYRQAIGLLADRVHDPTCTRAYAGLADSFNLLGDYGWRQPLAAFPEAETAAQKALEQDPNCAEAHAALAFTLFEFDLNWCESEQEFLTAIRLKPEYPSAHHWYAWYFIQLGRSTAATTQMNLALKYDPLSSILKTNLGKIDYYAGRYDDAIKYYKKLLQIDKDYTKAIFDLGLAYEQKGHEQKEYFTKALDQFKAVQAASKEEPVDPDVLAALGRTYAGLGQTNKVRDTLKALFNLRETEEPYVSPYKIATVYVALGSADPHAFDQAFAMLDTAWKERDSWLSYLKVDPVLKDLRTDPRFAPRFATHLKHAHLDGPSPCR